MISFLKLTPDRTLGLANMVERVDDSSMSDIDAAAVIVNKKDKQKEEDEKKAYQKVWQ